MEVRRGPWIYQKQTANKGTREIGQQLKEPIALSDNLGSVPRMQVWKLPNACNSNSKGSETSGSYTHVHKNNTCTKSTSL